LTAYVRSPPTPLIPGRTPPLPYPVEALGSVLAGFVRATVEATHCAAVTAAQSGLAVASLAAQAHADVTTPAGLVRPLSLFLVTVAASGERKSAADVYALDPVRQIESEDRESYKRDHLPWRNRHEAWEAERARIKRERKLSADGKRTELEALGPEPLPPLRPERTVADTTAEGLIKSWADCHGSRGLFTAEGAKVISGHSMSDDARLRTAATYSGLWDDGRAERIRAGDGFLSLRGRRLAVHLMAQPGVAAALIGAADLEDQGLTGRLLVCEAPELAGTRFFREPPRHDDPRFEAYREAVGRLMRDDPETWDGRNELKPRSLGFTAAARDLWIDLHDQIEARLRADGELGSVKAFGNKLAEHAARIAGVLTIFEDPHAEAIDADMIARVAELATFYGSEAVRLSAMGRVPRNLANAEKLRLWLHAWPEPLISLPDIENCGPNALRPKAIAEPCVRTLEEYGWLVARGPGEVKGVKRQETFLIVREADR
jgi:Protein of unknown function (DUF3987)